MKGLENMNQITPVQLLKKYSPTPDCFLLLMVHSAQVAAKALQFAKLNPQMKIDTVFLYEAAMLHDIGVTGVNAPEIGCFGEEPYIRHGWIGAEILEKEGFPKHAKVCLRHIGAGISAGDVRKDTLPLPELDYLPLLPEEKIVCLADKFYSKNPDQIFRVRTVKEAELAVARHGEDSRKRFRKMCQELHLITGEC